MKCDELEKWYAGQCSPSFVVYGANDVDEAIAELKAHIDDLEKLNHDLCERVTENDEIRLHWEEIEQTRAENESLKAKLESAQASAYAESVDAGMRERRLKRALWIARSEWARSSALSYHLIEDHPNKDVAATYKRKANKWEKVKEKSLKKAEEYK